MISAARQLEDDPSMGEVPRRVYLIVWWFAEFGGVERHVVELASSLQRHGCEVRIFSESPVPRWNQYRRYLRKERIPLWSPSIPGRLLGWILAHKKQWPFKELYSRCSQWMNRPRTDDARAQKHPAMTLLNRALHGGIAANALRRGLERKSAHARPDVVHVHGFRLGQTWVVPWALAHRLPVVYTEHSTISDLGGPRDPESIRFVEDADVIACVSRRSQRSLSAFVPHRDISVHNHIVRVAERNGQRVRDGSVEFISVARLIRQKGIDVLLRAAAIVQRQSHAFRLTIIGSGPERAALERLRHELSLELSVRFLGERSFKTVEHHLLGADVFVLASRTEGLPVAMLEAMAAGLAVIGTRVGGIPELLEGEAGLLVVPDSVEDLAQAMTNIVTNADLRSSLQNAALKRLRNSRYHERAALESILDSYRQASAENG
jgi:glycosyltransferase involved in cell wall biosynthesis